MVVGGWSDWVLLPVPEDGERPGHEQDGAVGEAGGRKPANDFAENQ